MENNLIFPQTDIKVLCFALISKRVLKRKGFLFIASESCYVVVTWSCILDICENFNI